MTQRHEHHYQTLDPFAALGSYELGRLERGVQAHLAAQACPGAPRLRIAAIMHGAGAWLRHRGLPYLHIRRRHPA